MRSDSNRFVGIVRELVRELSPVIVQAFRSNTRTPITKADGSLVTETDFFVERRLIAALSAAFPQVSLLGEEMASSAAVTAQGDAAGYYTSFLASDHQIIVDPIDGTRNFIEGKSPFCIAAAFASRKNSGIWPEASVVAVPLEGVMYWCDAGGVFREQISSGETQRIVRNATTEDRISASSKDRAWLSSRGYTLRYQWLSSGASVHDFIGTALGRTRASVVGQQRLWDLMAPLAIAHRLGCVLREIESGEEIVAIGAEALSADLEQRPWGLTRKMLLLPSDASLSGLLSAPQGE